MEDAVLGLIAEKLVEYRGKTFKSPDFVAWMDTNPHQKGNDLAFTDRIDMELLFKSVSSVDDTTNWSTSSRVRAVWNPIESCFHT